MTITADTIKQAKSDPIIATQVYKKIFFDGSKPKVKMWLINKGVNYTELDLVESDLRLTFMKHLSKYNNDKIPFEKYIWTEFNWCLINYFESKKLKKNSITLYDDHAVIYTNMDYDDGGETVVNIDLGYLPDNTMTMDVEAVFLRMTQLQASICRLIYYSDMTKDEIVDFLHINRDTYNVEMQNVRKIFKNYLSL